MQLFGIEGDNNGNTIQVDSNDLKLGNGDKSNTQLVGSDTCMDMGPSNYVPPGWFGPSPSAAPNQIPNASDMNIDLA